MFGAFPSQSWRVSASMHNCERNMDTALHSRDKGTVKTVGFWRGTGSKEGEDGEIGRQGDGHGFLGYTRNHLHRLLGRRTNDNCSVLCVVIAPVERRNQEKTSSFKKQKDPFPTRQCTGAHLRSFYGQNYRIFTSSVFSGFDPQWLFQISKLEKMARQTTVHVERGVHHPNRWLFWEPLKILFFVSLKKLEKCLEKCIELTVVGNFPRLMKFGHFHAPKSWSLLHLLTWFFSFCQELSDEQLWPWKFSYTNLGEIQPIWKVVEKCHFWTLGRILSPCRCNWKNTKPMVKVVHPSLLDKIKKNRVNRCSRLQDIFVHE